jgi:hypothetical protein
MSPLQIQFMLGRFKVTADTGDVQLTTNWAFPVLYAGLAGYAGYLLANEAGAKMPMLFAAGGAVVGWAIGGLDGLQVEST